MAGFWARKENLTARLSCFGSAFWDCNTSGYVTSQAVKVSVEEQGLLLFLCSGQNVLGVRAELKTHSCLFYMTRAM